MSEGRHIRKTGNEKVKFNPLKIIAIAFAAMAFALGLYVLKTESEYKEISDTYKEIAEEYKRDVKEEDTGSAENEEITVRAEEEEVFPAEVDFKKLLEQDNNICAWIYLEDTQIDYPVFQGEDNTYYLYYGMNGQYTGYGGIFLDAANTPDFSDSNSILYGHHMQNGSFFASLCDYKAQEFYDSHPVMYLATPTQNYRADVYSCYVTEEDSGTYTVLFPDTEYYGSWLKKTVSDSVIQTEVMPNVASRILTLSTCSYEFTGARCVVHCILTEV